MFVYVGGREGGRKSEGAEEGRGRERAGRRGWEGEKERNRVFI